MKKLEKVFLVPDRAKKMKITNDAEMEVARKALVFIADMMKEVKEAFRPIIKAAHATWKEALAKEEHYLKPLREGKETIDPIMCDYLNEKERERQAAEKEAAAKVREASKLLDQAVEAEEKGEPEMAASIMEQVTETADEAAAAVPEKTKLDGVHTRTDVKWRTVDAAKVPRFYLMLDEKKLNQLAKQMGMEAKVPGIEFYEKTTVITKAGGK